MNRIVLCLSCLLLLLGIAVSGGAMADNWVFNSADKFGLPEGGYRSQGITTDGKQWYFSWTNGMERTSPNYQVLAKNFSLFKSAIPQFISNMGGNHIGDIDFYDDPNLGKSIYVPIEDNPNYLNPFIAIYDAATLAYTGVAYKLVSYDLTQGVPWVAIDAVKKVAYTAEWTGTKKINVHQLADFVRVNDINLSTTLYRLQGGKVLGNYLYVSSDNAQKSIYRISMDGSVTEVLQIGKYHNLNDGYPHELEGLSLQHTSSGDKLDVLLTHGKMSELWKGPYTLFLHFSNTGP